MSTCRDCARFQDLLERSFERGEGLDQAELGFLLAHRERCRACDAEASILGALEGYGNEALAARVGNAELEMRVNRLLALEGARGRRHGAGAVRWALVGASALAAAAALLFAIRPDQRFGGGASAGAVAEAISIEDDPSEIAALSAGDGAILVSAAELVGGRGASFGAASRIGVGDELRTGRTGATIAFEDGTRALLGAHGRLSLDAASESLRRFTLGAGVATFAVAHLHGGRRFAVDTPIGTVRVRGTVFRVSCGADAAACEIRVADGLVELLVGDAAPIAIAAGQSYRSDAGETSPIEPDEAREMLAWAGIAGEPIAVASAEAEREPKAGEPPSVAELLERVGMWRAQRSWANVVATYRRIVRGHPRSAEARTCLVPMGEVQLEHLGAPAEALTSFRAYLAVSNRGSLAEEARWGEAVALGRLGRIDEERVSLRRFLEEHPRSLYAKRAREKLAMIDGGEIAPR